MTGAKVMFANHGAGSDEKFLPLAASYPPYPMVHAAYCEGWTVISPYVRGDSWGNSTVPGDMLAAYNAVAARETIDRVVVQGSSMGGATTWATVLANNLPAGKLKGVYLNDGVCSLAAMWTNVAVTSGTMVSAYSVTVTTLSGLTSIGATSLPTTGSFPTIGTVLQIDSGASLETVTTTGASTGTAVAVTATTKAHASGASLSDWPTRSSGFDPISKSATLFPPIRYRFWASSADATVNKAANADAMATLLGGTTTRELSVQTHVLGHVATEGYRPADLVAFLRRVAAD